MAFRRSALSACALLLGCADSQSASTTDGGAPSISEEPAVDGGDGLRDAGAESDARSTGEDQLLDPGVRDCPEIPIDLLRPVCASDGWCWNHPLPQGNTLTGSIGFTDSQGNTTELWAVGHVGTAIRLRGGVWEGIPTGTTKNLSGIWGTGVDDLWAVGDAGTVIHWDGAAWSPSDAHETVAFSSVWGSGRRDVWAVGARGHIVHWDGASWSASPNMLPADLNALWGVAGDARVNETRSLWAVGNDGALVHWNGARWSVQPPLYEYSSYAIFGSSADNVWMGGQYGMAATFDGSSWMTSPTRSPYLVQAMGGTSASDIWAAGGSNSIAHFDGKQWTIDLVGQEYGAWRSIWTCGRNRAWFFGTNGKIVEWSDEASYAIRNKALIRPGNHGGDIIDARSIAGSGPNDMWATATKRLLHWDGTAWTESVPSGDPLAIWASGPSDVHYASVVNKTGFETIQLNRWNGTTWSVVDSPEIPATTADMMFDGTGPNDVWFATSSMLLHFDGTSWETKAAISGYRLWASAPNDVWMTGERKFHHYEDGVVTSIASPGSKRLFDLWGPKSATSPASVAWAVGEAGAMARWDGTSWIDVPSVTSRDLRAIWGSSTNDIWATGDGVILHYDGIRWTPSYDVTTNKLGFGMAGGIWGNSANDVWAIGERGTILHRHVP